MVELSWSETDTQQTRFVDLNKAHLLEAKFLIGDLEENLDSVHGRHHRLGQHARQSARDNSLQSNQNVIAVVLCICTAQSSATRRNTAQQQTRELVSPIAHAISPGMELATVTYCTLCHLHPC